MESNHPVVGNFQKPGSAESFSARARLCDSGIFELEVEQDATLDRHCRPGEYSFGPNIPGLAVEIHFADGARFIPSSRDERWRGHNKKDGVLAFLESNVWTVAIAVVFTPLLVWWLVAVGIPKAAVASVALIPDSVPREMGRETLVILDRTLFGETALDGEKQQQVSSLWLDALAKLELPRERFALHFRSAKMGANAMALPDGSVIVTDDLVKLLEEDPDAILSVLLHEIGHVEHKHSLKLVAQSVATSVFFAAFFGDIEGAGEIIIGASSSLLQNAFSRDMEAEADEFAFSRLIELGISPAVFATALEALVYSAGADSTVAGAAGEGTGQAESPAQTPSRSTGESTGESAEGEPALLEYLSTHPLSRDRIEAARERATSAGF